MDTTLIFDENEFVVDKVKDFGEPIGEFRVIRYDTGYYALQRHMLPYATSGGLIWETLCIAPQLDTPLDNGYDWKFSRGRLTMNSFLGFIEDASKLQNNELRELHLHLNTNMDPEVQEEVIHLISSDDGKEIKDKILESLKLQDEMVKVHVEDEMGKLRYVNILLMIATICMLLICILSILKMCGII